MDSTSTPPLSPDSLPFPSNPVLGSTWVPTPPPLPVLSTYDSIIYYIPGDPDDRLGLQTGTGKNHHAQWSLRHEYHDADGHWLQMYRPSGPALRKTLVRYQTREYIEFDLESGERLLPDSPKPLHTICIVKSPGFPDEAYRAAIARIRDEELEHRYSVGRVVPEIPKSAASRRSTTQTGPSQADTSTTACDLAPPASAPRPPGSRSSTLTAKSSSSRNPFSKGSRKASTSQLPYTRPTKQVHEEETSSAGDKDRALKVVTNQHDTTSNPAPEAGSSTIADLGVENMGSVGDFDDMSFRLARSTSVVSEASTVSGDSTASEGCDDADLFAECLRNWKAPTAEEAAWDDGLESLALQPTIPYGDTGIAIPRDGWMEISDLE